MPACSWRTCCVSLLAFALASGEPLAVKLPSAFSAQDSEEVLRLADEVREESKGDAAGIVEKRVFGVGGAGHETVFLHGKLGMADGTGLQLRMLELALRADSGAGWGVAQTLGLSGTGDAREPGASTQHKLTPRCMEVIRYDGGEQNESTNVGWHNDGGTLLTTAIMLSAESDFEGGAVEFTGGRSSGGERYTLAAGDALVWRGWTQHRVLSVVSGRREVFVIEWWTGVDCRESQEPRGGDTVAGLRLALQVDPSSSGLHRNLGATLCETLPCEDAETAAAAEEAHRRALELAPKSAHARHGLGHFLQGGHDDVHDEGMRLLQEAHSQSPTVYADPALHYAAPIVQDEESELAADMKWQFKQVLYVTIGLVCAGSLIWCLESRMENHATPASTSARPAASAIDCPQASKTDASSKKDD